MVKDVCLEHVMAAIPDKFSSVGIQTRDLLLPAFGAVWFYIPDHANPGVDHD